MEVVEYGICRLSVVPVRKDPLHTAEQVTQLLFGDHYSVREFSSDRRWARVTIHFDGYEGWIDSKQHHFISPEYFEYINHAEFKITTDLTSTLLYNKSPQLILMGSVIPIASSELFRMEEQFAFNGESKSLGQRREYDFLRLIAFKYLNSPYQWGGRTPFGIDCSGYTQMVFRIGGYKLLRDAAQQATQGREVASLQVSRPGDLAFFNDEKGRITHTGFLLAEKKIIHASGKVRIDPVNEAGISHAESKVLTHRLAQLRRILPD